MEAHKGFFHHYMLIYRPYINRLNVQLAKFQLYSSQWAILNLLDTQGSHTNLEISNHQKVEKPTITRMIQRLEELNYVECIPGKDRREKKIQLTNLGKEVCVDVQLMIEQLHIEALQGISEQEQLEASRMLACVRENLIK